MLTWCFSRKEVLQVQPVSEMLAGGCGVEQDGVAELWEAAWILVWDLFSFFFFFPLLAVSAHLHSPDSGQAISSEGLGRNDALF